MKKELDFAEWLLCIQRYKDPTYTNKEELENYYWDKYLEDKKTLENEIEYCNKYKWGDCECEGDCRRGLIK